MENDRKLILSASTITTIVYLYAFLASILTVPTGGAAAVFLGLFIITVTALGEDSGFEIFFIIIVDIFMGTIIFMYLEKSGLIPLGIGTGLGILWSLFIFFPSIKELVE